MDERDANPRAQLSVLTGEMAEAQAELDKFSTQQQYQLEDGGLDDWLVTLGVEAS